MQPSRNNTYNVPASPEVTSYEQQQLYEAALEAATSAHEIDTADTDPRRVEGFGAKMVAAAEIAPPPASTKELFDYSDPAQLNLVAPVVLRIRREYLGRLNQSDVDLAA